MCLAPRHPRDQTWRDMRASRAGDVGVVSCRDVGKSPQKKMSPAQIQAGLGQGEGEQGVVPPLRRYGETVGCERRPGRLRCGYRLLHATASAWFGSGMPAPVVWERAWEDVGVAGVR